MGINDVPKDQTVEQFLKEKYKDVTEKLPILDNKQELPIISRKEALKKFGTHPDGKPLISIQSERERIKKEKEEQKKPPLPIFMEDFEPNQLKTSVEQIDESIECPSIQFKFVDNMPMVERSKKDDCEYCPEIKQEEISEKIESATNKLKVRDVLTDLREPEEKLNVEELLNDYTAKLQEKYPPLDEMIQNKKPLFPSGAKSRNEVLAEELAKSEKKPLKRVKERILNVYLKHNGVKLFPKNNEFALPHNAEYSIQINNLSQKHRIKFSVFLNGKDICMEEPSYLDANVFGENNNSAKMEISKYLVHSDMKFMRLEEELVIRFWKQFIPEKIDLNPIDTVFSNRLSELDDDYPNRCFEKTKYEENYEELKFVIKASDPVNAVFTGINNDWWFVKEEKGYQEADKVVDLSELKLNNAYVQNAEEGEKMAYQNGFVLAIKSNGQILREIKKDVFIAPNSEYSVFLKNTNSKDAQFQLKIGNRNLMDHPSILCAQKETEIFRFSTGEKFKLPDILIGGLKVTKKDDNKVSVKFQLEKDKITIENEGYKYKCYIEDMEQLTKEDGVVGFLKNTFDYLKDPQNHCLCHEEAQERKFEEFETELFVNIKENQTEVLVKDTKKKFCTNCGAKLGFNDKFCSECGAKCPENPLTLWDKGVVSEQFLCEKLGVNYDEKKKRVVLEKVENHESIDITDDFSKKANKKKVRPIFISDEEPEEELDISQFKVLSSDKISFDKNVKMIVSDEEGE